MTDWDSEQYLKFKKQRTRPSLDLARRINCENPARIIDIGCGPGNSSKVLADRYPNAEIIGVDNSINMIEKARKTYPGIKFDFLDAESVEWNVGKDFDIVFSNACIQWIPNHEKLLPKMIGLLKSGGVMAVQMPINHESGVHKIAKKIMSDKKWNEKLTPRPSNVLSVNEYHNILSGVCNDFEIWTTTYFHRLKGHAEIIEWYKSTGLKPYLDSLDDRDKAVFTDEIYREIANEYPILSNGEVILPFPRLFFVACQSS